LSESEDHVNAVAVAIQDKRGEVRGALTVAAPDSRLSSSDVAGVGRKLGAAAVTVVTALDAE